jgi:glycine/D-amino acid oxidase-like deaminating enzyme
MVCCFLQASVRWWQSLQRQGIPSMSPPVQQRTPSPNVWLSCDHGLLLPAGIGALVAEFAAPGDAEYEPPSAAAEHLPQPRMFRNKELELQVRLDDETKLEK